MILKIRDKGQGTRDKSWIAALFTLLLFILLLSCNPEKKHVISEKKFIDVLVDMHIAEAIGSETRRNTPLEYEVDSASLYGSVFEKHKLTRAMFDSTMIYYSRRPDRFQKIYNAVTARLRNMEEELREKMREEIKEVEVEK